MSSASILLFDAQSVAAYYNLGAFWRAPSSAPSLIAFAGAEDMTLNEFPTGNSGALAGSGESGSYSYLIVATNSASSYYACFSQTLNSNWYASFSFKFQAVDLPPTSSIPAFSVPWGSGAGLVLKLTSTGAIAFYNNNSLIATSGAIAADTWALFELKRVAGVATLMINGTTIGTVSTTDSHTQICLGANMAAGDTGGYFIDDVALSTEGAPGNIDTQIKRASSTTPTYNAFTKSTGSTIDTVWNDPLTASSSTTATSSTSGATQTMIPTAFVLGSSGLVSACKVVLTGLRGTGAACAFSILYRYGGVSYTTSASLTTSWAYYMSSIFRPTSSQLTNLEGGGVRAACTSQTTTIHDVGVICAFPK